MGSKSVSKVGKNNKQNGGKITVGKTPAKNIKRSPEQDTMPQSDLSVLRQPINISVKKVCDIVKMYQSCTAELRHLLDDELEIVYECKVCRNMFRSVANIISHKRVYCRQQFNEAKYKFNRNNTEEDYTVIIQPEPVPPVGTSTETWRTSDEVPSEKDNSNSTTLGIKSVVPTITRTTNSKKDLTQIIEELSDKRGLKTYKESAAHYSATNFYDDLTKSLMARAKDRKEHAIHLEPTGSPYGVFQTKLQTTSSTTIQTENVDLMRAQVFELQHMVRETEAVLDEDGLIIDTKVASKNVTPLNRKDAIAGSSESTLKDNHVCAQCGSRFSTRKTLTHHMKSLHTAFRMCYPCPCCKNTFSNLWSVYRHLYKVHRKSVSQVRKLRQQIINKAIKKEFPTEQTLNDNNNPIVKQESEAEMARKEQHRINLENKEWMENFEDDQELQRCGGCGRRFERRAALTSHSQICQKRIAARKVKVNSTVQGATDKVPQKLVADVPRVPVMLDDIDDDKCVVLDVSQRIRPSGVNSWCDVPKKEIPGKRIEIQIRRDYCKPGCSSSSINNPYNSPGRPQTPADAPEPNLMKLKEEIIQSPFEEEAPSDFNQSRIIDNIIKTTTLCTDADDSEVSGRCVNNTMDNNVLDGDESKNIQSDAETSASKSKLKRRQTSVDTERIHDTRSSSGTKRRRVTTGGFSESNKLSQNHRPGSSDELFSPVMEKRMQSFINLKRLQCLPCQKKFHKLTNLRRHVAVHIGWNRYKCTICTYKCFAKYDCVNHIVKIHGAPHQKAQEMVNIIDAQDTDINATNDINVKDLKTEKTEFFCEPVNNEEDPFSNSVNIDKSLVPDNSKDVITDSVVKGFPEIRDSEETIPNCDNEIEDEALKIDNVTDSIVESGESVAFEMNYSDENYTEHPELDGFVDGNLDNESDVPELEPHEDDPVIDAASEVSDLESIEQQQSDVSINGENDPYSSSPIKNETDGSLYEDSDEIQSEIREAEADPQDKALRRMVMEVIFGSNAAPQADPLMTINGFDGANISREGSRSPDSHRCASVQLYNSDHESRSSSPRSKSAASIPIEGERRIRPVRNRVKVKKEDFIYDLSDNTLNSRREIKKVKPQIEDSPKQGVKCVPKLMLVRTNISEISGNQSASWRSTYSQGNNIKGPDCQLSQNLASYNISTRKSPRVFDTKPLKPGMATEKNSKP